MRKVEYGKKVKEIRDKLSKYFGFDIGEIGINFLSSRKQINRLRSENTPRWLVGWVGKNNEIYILSKEKFSKESSHHVEYFDKVLKHEIAHLFIKNITKSKKPIWIHEGLPVFLAGQISKDTKEEDGLEAIKFFDRFSKEIYSRSGMFIYLLDRKFGSEKILKFLEMIPEKVSEAELEEIFFEVFGVKMNKRFLRDLLI